jgi:DNA-binding SARP family transcriptional activator
MAPLRIRLFGGFEASIGDRPLMLPPKEQAILAVLAATNGKELSRDRLAGLLWGDRGTSQARDSLKHAIAHIRHMLLPSGQAVIEADRVMVRLSTIGVEIDAARFTKCAIAGTAAADKEALGHWRGPFLDGVTIADAPFDDWVLVERARYQALAETVAQRVLARVVASGQLPEVVVAASRLLQIDPHCDTACRHLMTALVAQGETTRAVEAFLRFRDSLRRDLGVEPTRETQALAAAIRLPRAAPLTQNLAEPATGPSIAVLPFRNVGGDPSQSHLVDGISEDVISALAQYRWFTVLSRNACFSMRQADKPMREIAQALGVRYLLDGSVRHYDGRIRLTGELIDGETAAMLWSARFDRDFREILDLHDELARQVAGALEPELLIGESQRSRRRPLTGVDAYDFHMRGVWHHNQQDRAEDFDQAILWQQRAIAADPGFARAYMVLARSLYARCLFGHSPAVATDATACTAAAERAVALDSGDAYSHYATCLSHLMCGRPAAALAAAERAIAINPSLALAHNAVGWSRVFVGRATDSLDPLETALRLSPRDPLAYLFLSRIGLAQFHLGDYAAAVDYSRQAFSLRKRHFILVVQLASLGHLGRTDEAETLLPFLRQLQPVDSAGYWRMITIYARDADRQHLLQGLRKVGLNPAI